MNKRRKATEAVASLRNRPQANVLRALLERNMGINGNTYANESVGVLSPHDDAALKVIRAIFEGGDERWIHRNGRRYSG